MPKKEVEPTIRVHLWIYERDWEKLHEIYGATIKPSKAVRTIIRSFISNLESRVGSVEHKLEDLGL